MQVIDLSRLLGAQSDAEEKQTILPEAAVERLQEYNQRFDDNSFSNGDLITPRKGHNLRRVGWPHLVLKSVRGAAYPRPGETVQNILVAVLHDDEVISFWAAAHDFEPYVPVAQS